MKDKLITEILVSMASELSLAQLEDLQKVLTHKLNNVEIKKLETSNSQETTNNINLLDVFIAAKRIEGYSENR